MRRVPGRAAFAAAWSVALPVLLVACASAGTSPAASNPGASSFATPTTAPTPSATNPPPPTGDPAASRIAPGGQFLLYEDSGAWVVGLDGTGKRKVSEGSPVGWSHDGSTIHLATDATKSGCQVTQLSNLSIAGGSENIVPASLKHGDWDFAWSPDDSLIAFFRPTIQRPCSPQTKPDSRMDLMVVTADGTRQRKLAIGVPDGNNASLVWTPDGRSIVLIEQDDDPPFEGPILSIDVVTAAPTQIAAAAGSYVGAAVSKDVTQIAYIAADGGFDATHVANIDGSGVRNLGDNSSTDHAVTWAPVGSALAVLRGDRQNGPAHLLVAASPTAPLVDLDSPLAWKGAGPKVSWSADGTRVACVADAGGLVLIAIDGSGAVPVPGTAGATDAFWQP